ncbi:aldo/keto reductase [Poriferisphaera sp. WC338]|uniref:aldo/keto reductase n=1 Tax=Poriferisphaera sp. WC338 TaxID=3425129 RepID=UPI003D8158F7
MQSNLYNAKRLALGTAHFGQTYGINQIRLPDQTIAEILQTAAAHNINMLDTASAYGESEIVLGKAYKPEQQTFQYISKMPIGTPVDQIHKRCLQSITNLRCSSLYGYLLHDYSDYELDGKYKEIVRLKERGLAKKIGISFYYPEHLERVLNENTELDLIQIPFNVFDQRFAPYFAELKKRNIEIHVRSVFLQGIFFLNPYELPEHFNPAKPQLRALQQLSKQISAPLSSILINFVLSFPEIDRLVIGVNSANDLQENLSGLSHHHAVTSSLTTLKTYQLDHDEILHPGKWPRHSA